MAAAGIAVESQRFTEPCYRQQFEPFRPNLSVVDLLFAVGPAAAGLLAELRRFDRVLPAAPRALEASRPMDLPPANELAGRKSLTGQ